jgi:hypothetical protein
MLEPVLNAASRSFAGEAGRAMFRSESQPSFPDISPERHYFDFAWNADRRNAVAPGCRFAERGIPFSPLHDV